MFEKRPPLTFTANQPEIDTDVTAAGSVVEFLDRHLPGFPKLFRGLADAKNIVGEDDITQELYTYLQRLTYSENLFMFQFQRKYRRSRRSSDLGVLLVENPNPSLPSRAFFVFEAKRLPTPGSGREREYVVGNLGGIERFKRSLHGADLRSSGLVGYIQDSNNGFYWHGTINTWINDLITSLEKRADISWDSDDLLVAESDLGEISKFKSKSKRIIDGYSDTIQLYHYLFSLN